MTKEESINIINAYLRQYPVEQIGLFGSFARNEQKPDSDIDILISFKNPIDIFTFVRIKRELAEILGRKVDLVTRNSLHPAFLKAILQDLQIIAQA